MSREVHVRFWESAGVRFPRATQLPLYRQTEIYARSGVHIARSSMAQWVGICGVRLAPLADALKTFILGHGVIHVDETPVSLLAPGRGKTMRAYVWGYRTTNFAPQRAVLLDFCADRSGEHPRRVLEHSSAARWSRTTIRATTRCTPGASRPHSVWPTPEASCSRRTSSMAARSPARRSR